MELRSGDETVLDSEPAFPAGRAATTLEELPGADHLFLAERTRLVEPAQTCTRSGCV